jgi:esterase/lipase superfamily enzyme
MHRQYHKWYSTRLQRDMEILVFGHQGVPLLVFPTEKGRFFDFENFGMIEALGAALDEGRLQAFCLDSADKESWFNQRIPSEARIRRHAQYECYVVCEVVPFVRLTSGRARLITTGCSFGGYHALNLAVRYPHKMDGCVAMSGGYGVRRFLDGFWNDACLFLSPLDYLPILQSDLVLRELRQVPFVLATGSADYNLQENETVAGMLEGRNIPVKLDIRQKPAEHDWPLWRTLARDYLVTNLADCRRLG